MQTQNNNKNKQFFVAENESIGLLSFTFYSHRPIAELVQLFRTFRCNFSHFPSSLEKPRSKDKKLFAIFYVRRGSIFRFLCFQLSENVFYSLKYKLNYIAKSSSHWTKKPPQIFSSLRYLLKNVVRQTLCVSFLRTWRKKTAKAFCGKNKIESKTVACIRELERPSKKRTCITSLLCSSFPATRENI